MSRLSPHRNTQHRPCPDVCNHSRTRRLTCTNQIGVQLGKGVCGTRNAWPSTAATLRQAKLPGSGKHGPHASGSAQGIGGMSCQCIAAQPVATGRDSTHGMPITGLAKTNVPQTSCVGACAQRARCNRSHTRLISARDKNGPNKGALCSLGRWGAVTRC